MNRFMPGWKKIVDNMSVSKKPCRSYFNDRGECSPIGNIIIFTCEFALQFDQANPVDDFSFLYDKEINSLKEKMEAVGIELTTYRMRSDRSTTELCPQYDITRKSCSSLWSLFRKKNFNLSHHILNI